MKTSDPSATVPPLSYIKSLKFLLQDQLENHCGPTSLSSALSILGANKTQTEIVKIIGKRQDRVFDKGMGEDALASAAEALGFSAHLVMSNPMTEDNPKYKDNPKYIACGDFSKAIESHLSKGYPAIVTVQNHSHWVSVVGMLGKNFVVMDPAEEDVGFFVWDHDVFHKKTHAKKDSDGDTHVAVLISKRDASAAPIRVTSDLVDLCNRDGDTAGKRLKILSEYLHDFVVVNAGLDADHAGDTDLPTLHTFLTQRRSMLLSVVDYWIADDYFDVGIDAVERRLDSMIACASALSVRVQNDLKIHAAITAGITVILTFHALEGLDRYLSYGE